MTHTAYVIPAGLDEPGRTFAFETHAELAALLHGEIGAGILDWTPDLPTPYGPIRMWVDTLASARAEPRPVNPRATVIAEVAHHSVALAGTVVITGVDPAGEDAGLSAEHLAGLVWVMGEMARMYQEAATVARVDTIGQKMAAAIDARDGDTVKRLLADLEALSPNALRAGLMVLRLAAPDMIP